MSASPVAKSEEGEALRQLAMQIALQLPKPRREAEELIAILGDIVRWRAGDPYAWIGKDPAPVPLMKLV